LAENDAAFDGAAESVSSARLPVWRMSWLAGAFGLGAALLAGGATLGYAWLHRPESETPALREANLAVVDHLADNLGRRFDTPVVTLQRLGERFTANDLGADDTFAVSEALSAALAATPDLRSLGFVDQVRRLVEARREHGAITFALGDLSDDSEILQRMSEVEAGGPGSSLWRPIVPLGGKEGLTSRLAVPVFRDGRPLGMLRAQVTLPGNIAGAVAAGGSTPFILIGGDRVQYHPQLAAHKDGQALTATPVGELGDPAVTAIAGLIAAGNAIPDRLETATGSDLVALRELPGPGGEIWHVGAYRPLPRDPGIETLAPLAGLLGSIALVLLMIGAGFGARIDRILARQADAIASAAALKLGPRPRLTRSSVRGLEAINRAIARLGRRLTELPGLEAAGKNRPTPALPGPSPRPRSGEALVIWIEGSLPVGAAGGMPPADMAQTLNTELGLIADRIELEGGLALPEAGAIAGIWFTSPEKGIEPVDFGVSAPPADIRELAEDLVRIAGAPASDGAPARPTLSAGVAKGEVLLAEFGPPRQRRYGIAGPAAESARSQALAATRRVQERPTAIGHEDGHDGPKRGSTRQDDAPRGPARLSRAEDPPSR
jgi:hypothetical protein